VWSNPRTIPTQTNQHSGHALNPQPNLGSNMRKFFQSRAKYRKGSKTANVNASSATSLTTPPSTPPSDPLPPGDPSTALPRGYKVSPLEVRDLNELIRKRYALDKEIWSFRACKPRDRHLLLDKMTEADAALMKILNIVHTWDNFEVWESSADWQRLRTIRQRLEMEESGKRLWAVNPPWEDDATT
jgi:hypothetical protein